VHRPLARPAFVLALACAAAAWASLSTREAAPAQDAPPLHPPPAGDPIGDPIIAGRLLRQIQEAEAWLDTLTTCQAEWEAWEFSRKPSRPRGAGAGTATSLDLVARLASLDARTPNVADDAMTLALSLDLWPGNDVPPSTGYSLEYDPRRYRERSTVAGVETLACWNGSEGFKLSGKPPHSALTLFDLAQPNQATFTGWSWTFWPRAAEHHFWWASTSDPVSDPRHARACGTISLGDRLCTKLSDGDNKWYLIDPATGELIGVVLLGVSPDAPHLAIYNRIRSRRSLPELARLDEWGPWLTSLSSEDRASVVDEQVRELELYRRPYIVNRFGDWREIRPGCKVPFLTSIAFFDPNAASPRVESIRLARVKRFVVDEPLSNEGWDPPTRPDGMRVTDARLDPPVEWIHPNEPSAEEKSARVKEMKDQLAEADAHRVFQQQLVGTPAPEFPLRDGKPAEWLNGGPLTAADLKGKATIILFFATWCGPCRQELKYEREMIANGHKEGVHYIGVHAAGTRRPDVEAFLAEMGFDWPTMIDLPNPEQQAFGIFNHLCRVRGIPEAMLVDQDGRIVGFGDLERLREQAITIARQAAPKQG
jgi:thiol-disulfide isomerase/thioredoxin